MSTQTHPLPDSVACEPGLRKGMGSGVGKAADSLVKGLFEKKQK